MDLDRYLAKTQAVGYLLVQQSIGDQPDDFPLARCQQIVGLTDAGDNLFLMLQFAIPFQGGSDCIDKILILERLCHEIESARLHGLDGHLDVTVSRQEYDRESNTFLKWVLLQGQAAPAPQPNVKNETTRHVRHVRG